LTVRSRDDSKSFVISLLQHLLTHERCAAMAWRLQVFARLCRTCGALALFEETA
jgi:hypothetical protein